ncbi:MAG: DUF4105 domain-containing protein [Kiritimatiellae bacterium]|nr:DUF4105 domain-containing protein [Kiritimatiellia bacterium]
MSFKHTYGIQLSGTGPTKRPLWLRALERLSLFLMLAPFAVWGVLVFFFSSWPGWIGRPLGVFYALANMAILLLPIRRALCAFIGLFIIPLACFHLMRPSNSRAWQPDVTMVPYAEIDGDKVTLYNVRNCSYVNETNFTVHYETRSYDVSQLKSADILFTDWGPKDIAHTMLSFGFEGGDYLCVSIETRKEVGETYSALKGFFRQYELIYIASDERDVVRLRTNFRKGESVYLYRLQVVSLDHIRDALREYLLRMNQLHERAEWYNAMTDNCMTSAFRIMKKHAAKGRADLHWSVILNGYAPNHAYTTGVLDRSLPFDELKRRSLVNSRAQAAGQAADFSAKIREGMPGMDWLPGSGQNITERNKGKSVDDDVRR